MIQKLKQIELFEGTTVDMLFKEIFERSTEERQKALDVFDNITARFKDNEDVFMIGDKANPYLDIAQKATSNITKMIDSAQKFAELDSLTNRSNLNEESVLDILEKSGIVPEEYKERDIFKYKKNDIEDVVVEDKEDVSENNKKVSNFFDLKFDDNIIKNKDRWV